MIEIVGPIVAGVVALAGFFGVFLGIRSTDRKIGKEEERGDQLERDVEEADERTKRATKARPGLDAILRVGKRMRALREKDRD
jgi:Tfp pilus assembly protein PilN